jgi:hypothetical protein
MRSALDLLSTEAVVIVVILSLHALAHGDTEPTDRLLTAWPGTLNALIPPQAMQAHEAT